MSEGQPRGEEVWGGWSGKVGRRGREGTVLSQSRACGWRGRPRWGIRQW